MPPSPSTAPWTSCADSIAERQAQLLEHGERARSAALDGRHDGLGRRLADRRERGRADGVEPGFGVVLGGMVGR